MRPDVLLSALLAAGAATCPAQAQAEVEAPPPAAEAPEPLNAEAIAQLVEQHAALMREIERVSARIERLVRAVREEGHARLDLGDLGPVLADLNSDDYLKRQQATLAMRRSLVDRMWLLLETPDLSAEARQRMRSILVETSAMVRLTRVAAELGPSDRDALWNLLDDAPEWVLDALGDDAERLQDALRHRPPGHDLGSEIIVAALIRDEMRPLPQLLALSEVHDATSPLLREALLSLLELREPPEIQQKHMVSNNREQTAALAVQILAEHPWPELVGHLLAYLRTTERFSARLDSTIVEALVKLRARNAAGPLAQIAHEKRARMSGGHGIQGVMIRPGDCELIGAALLMGMDLASLKVQVKKPWADRDPSYYGFQEPPEPENPDRVAAYAAVKETVDQAGPYEAIPGYEDALRRFQGELRPVAQ